MAMTVILRSGESGFKLPDHEGDDQMASRGTWIVWLQVALVGVLAYALVLVFAGSIAGSLFGLLNFGPPESIDTPEVQAYLKLPYLVLGAVLAGWALLLLRIVSGPLREGARWAWPAVVQSLVLWFVLDTGMSLVLGFPTHALFNLGFAVILGVPLWMLRRTDASIG